MGRISLNMTVRGVGKDVLRIIGDGNIALATDDFLSHLRTPHTFLS